MPQILEDQLTLSQPGGQIMPTKLLFAPPDFQTFLRPWHGTTIIPGVDFRPVVLRLAKWTDTNVKILS